MSPGAVSHIPQIIIFLNNNVVMTVVSSVYFLLLFNEFVAWLTLFSNPVSSVKFCPVDLGVRNVPSELKSSSKSSITQHI